MPIDTGDQRAVEDPHKNHRLALAEAQDYETGADAQKNALIYLLSRAHHTPDPQEKQQVRHHLAAVAGLDDVGKRDLAAIGEIVNAPHVGSEWRIVTQEYLSKYPELIAYGKKIGDSALIPPSGKASDLTKEVPENKVEILNNERDMVAPGTKHDAVKGKDTGYFKPVEADPKVKPAPPTLAT